MRFVRGRKRLVVIALPIVILVAATAAWAIWSWTQSTNALQAKAGGTATLTFSNPTPADFTGYVGCTPGGSCDLIGEVTNPTTSALKIVSYQSTVANGFNATGCPASNFTGPAETTTLTTLATPINVPPSASGLKIVLPNALSMVATADSACINQVISVTGGNQVTLGLTAGN